MIKKRFKEYIGSGTLTIFDIDETLFHTKANVAVVKDGKVRLMANQRPYEVALDKLSQADRDFVEKFRMAVTK